MILTSCPDKYKNTHIHTHTIMNITDMLMTTDDVTTPEPRMRTTRGKHTLPLRQHFCTIQNIGSFFCGGVLGVRNDGVYLRISPARPPPRRPGPARTRMVTTRERERETKLALLLNLTRSQPDKNNPPPPPEMSGVAPEGQT